MRKGKKALDIIVALILLVFACMCFFSLYGNYIGLDNVQSEILNVLNQEWGFYLLAVLASITAAYGLFLFLRALITKTRERGVRLKKDDGKVYLTESSVKSVVLHSVRTFYEVSQPEVSVKIHGGKHPTVHSRISCTAKGQYDLQDLAERIQKHVREDVEHYVGFPAGNVEVTFTDSGEPKAEAVTG